MGIGDQTCKIVCTQKMDVVQIMHKTGSCIPTCRANMHGKRFETHTKDLKPIQKIIDPAVPHLLVLSKNFPRALLYGPMQYAGLGIPPLHCEQIADQVTYFFHHMWCKDQVGFKMRCSVGYAQLETEMGTNIFQLDYETCGYLTTKSLITHMWKETSKIDITFAPAVNEGWVPLIQHEQDDYLMELVISFYTKKDAIEINSCRMFLNAVMILDVTAYDGLQIHP